MVDLVEVDEKLAVRFVLQKQSSLAPEREVEEVLAELELREDGSSSISSEGFDFDEIDPRIRLMYLVNEGDLEGIKELLDSGTDVNFKDIDNRTALHVGACQGYIDVVKYLLQNGAHVDPKDRWGSTPLADAAHYKNHDVMKLLESHGAKPLVAPMRVKNAREVPEYEIDPKELDFTNSKTITKGTFRVASWRGIQVAVKQLAEDFIDDEEKVKAFCDELSLLQKIRHPNVVQFLGAVTQSSPMMIVTEYLPKSKVHFSAPDSASVAVDFTAFTRKNEKVHMALRIVQALLPFYIFHAEVVPYCIHSDLSAYLKRKGALKPAKALRFAMDIARGLNYLHEHNPYAIIHRDLEPANILRDDSGHLKVADFGLSKPLILANRVKEDKPLSCEDDSCRYVAPEVFKNEEYDTKVDVFSFALILQEMIEGCQPFSAKKEDEVAIAYAAKDRPPFRAPVKHYAHGLRELIEECWSENASKRPTFKKIIRKLESMHNSFTHKRRWKVRPLRCFHVMEATSSVGSRTLSSHTPGSI